jgi:hypothetical protein
MSSPEDIANAFVNHYYTTLNSNPQALAGLYVSIDPFNPLLPQPLTPSRLHHLATTIHPHL